MLGRDRLVLVLCQGAATSQRHHGKGQVSDLSICAFDKAIGPYSRPVKAGRCQKGSKRPQLSTGGQQPMCKSMIVTDSATSAGTDLAR